MNILEAKLGLFVFLEPFWTPYINEFLGCRQFRELGQEAVGGRRQ